MKKMWVMIMVAILLCGLLACGQTEPSDENTHIPGEPDVINSIRSGNDEMLTVIANRDEIEDKEEFAKLLVKMCQENSFHTIKFSTDFGYATRLNMHVYLWRDEIEGNDPVMTVDFKPVEWNAGYEIVNNPDMFELYIDGELI